jgi:uncharacterized membrane protein
MFELPWHRRRRHASWTAWKTKNWPAEGSEPQASAVAIGIGAAGASQQDEGQADTYNGPELSPLADREPASGGQSAESSPAQMRPGQRSDDVTKPGAVFIYIGSYPSEAAARADYEVVKDLDAVGAVGTYDAAVVTKDAAGKLHENKDGIATRHGAWGGAAVGALIGILFPPAFIAATAAGAAVGGVSGYLWRGMSRADVKELADLIDDGQAALVIVGDSTLARAVYKAELKAEKYVAKQLDVNPKDIDKAVREAADEIS